MNKNQIKIKIRGQKTQKIFHFLCSCIYQLTIHYNKYYLLRYLIPHYYHLASTILQSLISFTISSPITYLSQQSYQSLNNYLSLSSDFVIVNQAHQRHWPKTSPHYYSLPKSADDLVVKFQRVTRRPLLLTHELHVLVQVLHQSGCLFVVSLPQQFVKLLLVDGADELSEEHHLVPDDLDVPDFVCGCGDEGQQTVPGLCGVDGSVFLYDFCLYFCLVDLCHILIIDYEIWLLFSVKVIQVETHKNLRYYSQKYCIQYSI